MPPTPWQGNTSSVSSSVDEWFFQCTHRLRDDARAGADEDALADADVAGRRRDRDEPDDRADAGAERRRFVAAHAVEEDPRQRRRGRRGVGRRERHRGLTRRRQRRSGVEPEPAEPQHARARESRTGCWPACAPRRPGGSCGGRAPSRRPARRSPADMCTTVPPAKSSTPSLCRKPSGCQVQCASGA